MAKRPTAKWKRMAEMYRVFAEGWSETCDFSDSMAQEMYEFETFGRGCISQDNGFAIGKKWMDVTIEMWKYGIDDGLLSVDELRRDGRFPDWFLRRCGIV